LGNNSEWLALQLRSIETENLDWDSTFRSASHVEWVAWTALYWGFYAFGPRMEQESGH